MDKNQKPLTDQLNVNVKKKDKAQEVFWKLYAKNNGKRNPFDDIRTETYPITKDVKPGVDEG
jgi:hypothetical protein